MGSAFHRQPPLILVVEDEPHLREVICFQLRAAGFEVLDAPDGERALALALTAVPDLVLSDILMPGFDGNELLKKLRWTRHIGASVSR